MTGDQTNGATSWLPALIFDALDRSLVAHYAVFCFISVVVQLFYAARLSTLHTGRRQRLLVGGVVVLAATQLGVLSQESKNYFTANFG